MHAGNKEDESVQCQLFCKTSFSVINGCKIVFDTDVEVRIKKLFEAQSFSSLNGIMIYYGLP